MTRPTHYQTSLHCARGALNLPLDARTCLTLEVEAGAEPLLGAKLKL